MHAADSGPKRRSSPCGVIGAPTAAPVPHSSESVAAGSAIQPNTNARTHVEPVCFRCRRMNPADCAAWSSTSVSTSCNARLTCATVVIVEAPSARCLLRRSAACQMSLPVVTTPNFMRMGSHGEPPLPCSWVVPTAVGSGCPLRHHRWGVHCQRVRADHPSVRVPPVRYMRVLIPNGRARRALAVLSPPMEPAHTTPACRFAVSSQPVHRL